MKLSTEQIMKLSTEEFTLMKGKDVEIILIDNRIYIGMVEGLMEASISHPSNLIVAIIVGGKTIDIVQIRSMELK